MEDKKVVANFEQKQTKLTPEKLAQIREAYAEALEDMFTDPRFPLMDYHDTNLPDKIRQGGKAPGGGYIADILLRVGQEVARVNSDEDFNKLKREFIE